MPNLQPWQLEAFALVAFMFFGGIGLWEAARRGGSGPRKR